MKTPFTVDLSSKVIAITGAGGIICSEFAKALAANGAKVALLDINEEAAKKYADEIGENALAVKCNCLDKESIIAAKKARFREELEKMLPQVIPIRMGMTGISMSSGSQLPIPLRKLDIVPLRVISSSGNTQISSPLLSRSLVV